MSNNDPTKWEYFEAMDTREFLAMCLYFKDKQDDIREQQEMNKHLR